MMPNSWATRKSSCLFMGVLDSTCWRSRQCGQLDANRHPSHPAFFNSSAIRSICFRDGIFHHSWVFLLALLCQGLHCVRRLFTLTGENVRSLIPSQNRTCKSALTKKKRISSQWFALNVIYILYFASSKGDIFFIFIGGLFVLMHTCR